MPRHQETLRRALPGAQPLLAYVTADRAALYRVIVDLLFSRVEQYQTPLRAEEVLSGIRAAATAEDDPHVVTADLAGVESCLDQLAIWGNVSRTRDQLHSTSLRLYENRGYVYGLTQAGEAAHRALQVLEEDLERSGGLQSTMLRNVGMLLLAIESELERLAPDPAVLFTRIEELHANFRSMTSSASVFMQQVDRLLSDPTLDSASFRLFKADTIAYLNGFIDDLERSSATIQDTLRRLLSHKELDHRIRLAATVSGEFPLNDTNPASAWSERVRMRLNGLHTWFCGAPGSTPQVELLQRRATSAVLGIVTAIERLSEARNRSAGGMEDFLAVARLFQRAASDEEGHRLYRGIMGLAAARHFTLAEEDADLVPPTASWWEAPAVEVPAKLRTAGRAEHVRRASRVPDYTASKAAAAEQARAHQRQVDVAAAELCALGKVRMSELPVLSDAVFDLLMSMIEAALHSSPSSDDGTRQATSLDGRLSVQLMPPLGDSVAQVTTARGKMICQDYTVRIHSASIPPAPAGAAVPEPRTGPASPETASEVHDAIT
ncbi:TIGR02677 family protein [Streptomyces sp. NPDC088354]|uniref:TIGR02677 family protein n=1 Tax=Streptomyces sp. NPDC088354 TaxID=3365856 RepID=UPI0037F3381B